MNTYWRGRRLRPMRMSAQSTGTLAVFLLIAVFLYMGLCSCSSYKKTNTATEVATVATAEATGTTSWTETSDMWQRMTDSSYQNEAWTETVIIFDTEVADTVEGVVQHPIKAIAKRERQRAERKAVVEEAQRADSAELQTFAEFRDAERTQMEQKVAVIKKTKQTWWRQMLWWLAGILAVALALWLLFGKGKYMVSRLIKLVFFKSNNAEE